jgi:hypothetical protein
MRPSRDRSPLVRGSARRLYASRSANWPQDDGWNAYKHQEIERFILKTGLDIVRGAQRTLDAGAGDSTYHWMPPRCISLDRYKFQLTRKANAVVGDIERMPFSDSAFDLVICVGSVLNYLSAAEAMNEIARIIASQGYLFLHFESSKSFEQIFSRSWGALAYFNKTTNGSQTDYVWVYSPNYILSLLRALRFHVIEQARFHILSALACRFGIHQRYACHLAGLDKVAKSLSYFADDIVILAQKI